jgi:hypothetical protein
MPHDPLVIDHASLRAVCGGLDAAADARDSQHRAIGHAMFERCLEDNRAAASAGLPGRKNCFQVGASAFRAAAAGAGE